MISWELALLVLISLVVTTQGTRAKINRIDRRVRGKRFQ